MLNNRRGWGKQFTGALALALLLPTLGACAPAVGGGVLVAVVAIGALTSHCYDYIDVSVYDAQGRKTCTATVTATNGGDEFELKSCYYAPLTDGHWTVRAKLPGSADAVTSVDVDHANDCTRHVQSMELTFNPAGAAPITAAPVSTPTTATLPPAPPPPAVSPSVVPPAPVPPSAPASANAAPPPASAAPTASPTPPSVGIFPDQGSHPSPPK